jgi:hypothetical protein
MKYFENKIPPDKKRLEDIKIATYQLDYGKGQVIMMGIFGQNLANNEKFMKFFDSVIIPKSLCPKFLLYK